MHQKLTLFYISKFNVQTIPEKDTVSDRQWLKKRLKQWKKRHKARLAQGDIKHNL